MRSLRSRLILGSSLIAVIPLAVAMLLLSRRIESMVRAQASERLDATLASVTARLASDAETMAERIRLLAREPQLRRLYLVRPAGGAELAEHLAERRFVLGLDGLRVTDMSGAPIGDDTGVRMFAGRGGSEALALGPAAGDSALALIARAPILYEGAPVGTVEGGVLLGAEYLAALRAASGVELALADRDGRPIASTRPAEADDRGRSWLTRQVPLAIGAPPQPTIAGFASTAAADGTVRALQWTAGLLGLLGLALAVLLGLVWSSQVSRPVERLAAFSQRVAQGQWDEPLTLHSVRELETLVAALDRMRTDLAGYRDRLVISERQAAWSQMAREIAHEVRNPLTPIAVSVADLKRSYGRADFPEILDQAARTIGDQVESLRRLLQEFSDFGRLPPPQFAPVNLADLFADLATLYAREAEAGRLALEAPGADLTLEADGGQLRQALVNLVKNGLEALDGAGRVTVAARRENGALALTVADDGPGLSDEQRARLFVPGFTTKARGSGLGLTIVERIVNDHQGTITVDAGSPRGTVFRIRLPLTRPAVAPAAGAPHPEA